MYDRTYSNTSYILRLLLLISRIGLHNHFVYRNFLLVLFNVVNVTCWWIIFRSLYTYVSVYIHFINTFSASLCFTIPGPGRVEEPYSNDLELEVIMGESHKLEWRGSLANSGDCYYWPMSPSTGVGVDTVILLVLANDIFSGRYMGEAMGAIAPPPPVHKIIV